MFKEGDAREKICPLVGARRCFGSDCMLWRWITCPTCKGTGLERSIMGRDHACTLCGNSQYGMKGPGRVGYCGVGGVEVTG